MHGRELCNPASHDETKKRLAKSVVLEKQKALKLRSILNQLSQNESAKYCYARRDSCSEQKFKLLIRHGLACLQRRIDTLDEALASRLL